MESALGKGRCKCSPFTSEMKKVRGCPVHWFESLPFCHWCCRLVTEISVSKEVRMKNVAFVLVFSKRGHRENSCLCHV